jgi:cell division protein FtsZ
VAMNFRMDSDAERETTIKVVGVGGAGGNAVNRMVQAGMRGVEFISLNTDYGALSLSHATYKLNIGARLTKGQGAGGRSDIGQRAAEESRDEIASLLKDADMVFITAGMGGGTGTGAAPIVAEIARDLGALTVGVVTKPFLFEGRRRMETADMGVTALREHVDALLIIPNERLRELSAERLTLQQAFLAADEVLRQGVQSISELISVVGVVNLDFEDVKAVMKDAGNAHMGVGRASGKDKAREAAQNAIASPLLETSIDGAKGVIVNFSTSPDVALDEVATASDMISAAAHPDVNLIWGVAFDENLEDEMVITVIATGFDNAELAAIQKYNFKGSPGVSVSGELKPQSDTGYGFEPVRESNPAASVLKSLGDEPPEQSEPQLSDGHASQPAEDTAIFDDIMRIFDRRK